jgi:uncharacterized protein DUF4139/flagellar FliG-like protein/uncharacterized protein DUF4140
VLKLDSEIVSVIVFQSGAEVSRRVSLSAGLELPARFCVTGLPPCLSDSSVSARVEGGSDLAVVEACVGLEVRDDTCKEAERLRSIDKETEELSIEIQFIEEDIEQLSQLDLRSRPNGKEGEPPPTLPLTSRLEFLQFRTEELSALRERRREVEASIETLEEEKKDLKRTVRRDCRVGKQVEISLQGEGSLEKETFLTLKYRVPGARWAPTYQLRFDTALSRVEAQLRVLVAQDTGEDWEEVELSVTSARAERLTQLGELASERIGKSQPPPPASSWKAPPSDTLALFEDFDRRLNEEGGVLPRELLSAPRVAVSPGSTLKLTRRQKVAVLLMCLEPKVSAEAFSQLGPELIQSVTMEITKLPDMSTEDRSQVCQEFRANRILLPEDKVDTPRLVEFAQAQFEVSDSGGSGGMARELSATPPAGAKLEMRASPVKKRKAASVVVDKMSSRRVLDGMPPKKMAVDAELLEFTSRPELVKIPDPSTRDYARLIMPSAQQASRGRLQIQSLQDQVSKLAVLHGLERKELVDQVSASIGRAERVESVRSPGHGWPRWPGEEPFDLHFQSHGLCRVPSDATFHGQLIKEYSLPVKTRYVTVPRETQQVFRSVEAEAIDVFPPGPVDIYLGGDFLLSGTLDGAAPGGTLRLALGVEERIKVARNTRFQESVSGMVSKSRRLEHTLEVELVNNLSREATVEVRERLPQPARLEKDIEVTVDSSSPEWETFKPDDSPEIAEARRWVVKLQAGEKSKLQAQYTITVPQKYELQGGNRRD